jgi:hypothetical protein
VEDSLSKAGSHISMGLLYGMSREDMRTREYVEFLGVTNANLVTHAAAGWRRKVRLSVEMSLCRWRILVNFQWEHQKRSLNDSPAERACASGVEKESVKHLNIIASEKKTYSCCSLLLVSGFVLFGLELRFTEKVLLE